MLVVLLAVHLLGGGGSGMSDYGSVLGGLPSVPSASESSPAVPSTTVDSDAQFVSTVAADVQRTWATELERADRRYSPTVVVLFTSTTQSGCGLATSQTGPFYCPSDRKVYLDLGFFGEMEQRLGAPGDFAQAYVIAHEFGHHIENLLGILAEVRAQERSQPSAANALSIRVELMADCFAGLWAHSAYQRGLVTTSDMKQAVQAAAAVGDDRLQKSAGGRVNPDQWTHGSSAQRVQWLEKGFSNGRLADCDTFQATNV